MKIKKMIVILAFFIISLCIVYITHIKFFRVDVIFYDAIFDALITTLITAIILFTIEYFKVFNYFEKIQIIFICILTGYALAISIPTIIDRSLSFYILEKLQQRGGGIKLSSFEEVFTKEYLKEHHLIDVRLTEQKESGTINIINDCVKLTKYGAKIANFSRYFRQNLLPKKRLLMGEYTNKLINPFKNSYKIINYKCQ